jgi:alkylated DNA repair protein alkB family protein 1
VRWSLEKQARDPNPTNLDIHYHLPKAGLWNSYIRHKSAGEELTVQPKAIDADVVEPPSSGPRQLIDNTPLSPENYRDLAATPKPPPAPSASVQPTPISALLYKLRWANIGWYYHWGTKQYDFSHGKGEIDSQVRSICKSAVEAVDWNQVYDGTEDVEWDQSDPEWKSWGETYGQDNLLPHGLLQLTVRPSDQNLMQGLSTSIRPR